LPSIRNREEKMQEPAGSEIGRVYFPSSPGEFITLFAHFHRAEIARMAGWRDRIDRTTNWAITLVAAMLSVSLSTSNAHHSVLMFAMVLAFFLLMIESRRYRFFDVYRSRVRRLERNYYAKLFDPGLTAEEDWQRIMAADLQTPTFVMSMAEAVSRRLRRNYIWIFLILLGAWALKVTFPSFSGEIPAALTFPDWIRNAGVGHVSGWIISATVLAFYGWLVVAALRTHGRRGELAHGDAHV
jgi:uncharacterized membrane protein